MRQLNPSAALNNANLIDFLEDFRVRLMNQALSSAGLAIGSSSKTKVKIANTVAYLSNGVFKSKTTAEVAFTATTHDIAANADAVQEAVYLLCLAADGTPSLTMGEIASGAGNAEVPETPSGKTPIGYLRLAVAAGATPFDASTDELDAAHLTDTYVNLGFFNNSFEEVVSFE